MVGTVVAEVRANDPDATVDGFAFKLVLWASVAYLALVLTLLMMFAQSRTPIDDLKDSSKLVTAVYAIVGVALGTLFVSKRAG
jgi:formate-dependent nitrite reductase membrane component NrfD